MTRKKNPFTDCLQTWAQALAAGSGSVTFPAAKDAYIYRHRMHRARARLRAEDAIRQGSDALATTPYDGLKVMVAGRVLQITKDQKQAPYFEPGLAPEFRPARVEEQPLVDELPLDDLAEQAAAFARSFRA